MKLLKGDGIAKTKFVPIIPSKNHKGVGFYFLLDKLKIPGKTPPSCGFPLGIYVYIHSYDDGMKEASQTGFRNHRVVSIANPLFVCRLGFFIGSSTKGHRLS